MKSRAKYTLPPEFERVIEILDKEVSVAVIRDVFLALYPAKAELKERIRSCEICLYVFWASYKNSLTCSESCRNALRQRKHRAKNKDAINAKRRENYQNRVTFNRQICNKCVIRENT